MNLSDRLLQLFRDTTDSVHESMRSKVIWVWDGAHLIELILKHTLLEYPDIRKAKESLASLTKFFRENVPYETVRKLGLASSKCLYTPKLDKDMKFVAHDSTIVQLLFQSSFVHRGASGDSQHSLQ